MFPLQPGRTDLLEAAFLSLQLGQHQQRRGVRLTRSACPPWRLMPHVCQQRSGLGRIARLHCRAGGYERRLQAVRQPAQHAMVACTMQRALPGGLCSSNLYQGCSD